MTRNEFIEAHLPLARRLAARYARSADSAEDLVQVASLGLVKAVDRFEPSRGVPFERYAIPTIIGELKRHLRDTRWALHVSRDQQERAQAVARERDRLTVFLGRAPTIKEVARSLGIAPESAIEADDAMNGLDALSLDAPASAYADPDETTQDLVGEIDPGYELVEERETLAPALGSLPLRDHLALKLRFLDDMTQREIADALGVSQMHVSRILRRALADLRDAVAMEVV